MIELRGEGMNKSKKGSAFSEDFDKTLGTIGFFDKGDALRIASEIVMKDKEAKMKAALEKLRETREANQIAARKMLEEAAQKKPCVRLEMPQEPIATDKATVVSLEVVESLEIDEKNKNMMIAIESL